ncbi:MAG: hypothetical protein ACO2OX_04885 [Candidatus Nanopusillus sp.]|jgi:uncharacterized protein YjhX (UPF0386 family)
MITKIDERVKNKIERMIKKRKIRRKLSPITNYKKSAPRYSVEIGDKKYLKIFKSLKNKKVLKNNTGRNYYVRQLIDALKQKEG